MITEKQAKIMAQQYCEENQANLFIYHGFVAGVDAALNILLPEINAKRAENTSLNLENAAIAGERDLALMEIGMAIADMENGAQKNALERLKKLLEK